MPGPFNGFQLLPSLTQAEEFFLIAVDRLKPLVGLLFVGCLLLCAWKCTYNLYLHPLSCYSGPKLWAATYLTYWYYAFHGDVNAKIKALHEKYGEVIRIAPGRLSFTAPGAWRDIYVNGHKNEHETLRKDPVFYAVFREKGVPLGLNNAEGPYHARLRKQLSYAFSDKALKEQEPLIRKHIDMLISRLRVMASTGAKADMTQWYNFATFDINGDLSFGESFGCLASSTQHPWIETIQLFVSAAPFLQFTFAYPAVRRLVVALIPKRVHLARASHNAFVNNKVGARLREEDDSIKGGPNVKRDFISYLLRHKPDQDALTEQEIIINASMLVIAGSETTATAMAGVTFWLLRTPHALEKATEEVRGLFQEDTDIDFSSTTSTRLPYLAACIEEGLRMHPPTPAGLPRVVENDIVVAGNPIPKNTIVSVHHYSTYRSKHNFHLADEFRPERWLATPDPSSENQARKNSSDFAADKKSSLQPFLVGPRNCIGQALAYAELRVVLARILWNFDLTMCAESERWDEQKSFNLWVKRPLWVKLRLKAGKLD